MRKILTLSLAICLLSTLSFNKAFATLEVGDFKAYKDGSLIVVSWQQLQEVNLNSYVVERSLDGDNWSFAGRVSEILGEQPVYTFKDINVPDVNTVIYYRVKAYYTDDTFEISDVIYLKGFEPVPTISIAPNPVFDDIVLNLSNDISNEGFIEIYNSAGMLVMQETIQPGLMQVSFSAKKLAAGFYVMKVQSGRDIKTQKFIKR